MAEGEEGVDWEALEGLDSGLESELPPGVELITDEQMAKRLLWDVALCNEATQVRDLLGYQAASDDVEDMEHKESHLRLAHAAPATVVIGEMARHVTAAIVGSMIVSSGDEVSEDDRNEVIARTTPMIAQGTYAILAELLDMGLLHFPHFQVAFTTEVPS